MQRSKLKILAVEDVEFLAHDFAKRLMMWNEPIPDFKTRYPNVLESCLATPFQTYGGKQLYKGLIGKGAILFYLMVKNYPFKNGNKRIAITTLLTFLFINQKWLMVDPQEFYNFARFIAESPPAYKESMVDVIRQFLKKNIVTRKKADIVYEIKP